MKQFRAIAAMSLNRVIGQGGKIPWHIPEDFRWFKSKTIGQVVVMGRKTFESLGKPLPNRTNIVLTRGAEIPGVITVRSLAELDPARFAEEVFIIGGGELYKQALPICSDLYLSIVQEEMEGDTFFPAFEDAFDAGETVLEEARFKVVHYRRRPPST